MRLFCSCLLVIASVLGLSLFGCAGETKRVDANALYRRNQEEAGAGLSSQDFRSMCERMAREITQLPQIQQAVTPPTVLVEVKNQTEDAISVDLLAQGVRKSLIEQVGGKIILIGPNSMTDTVNRNNKQGTIANDVPGVRGRVDFFLTLRIEHMRALGRAGETRYRWSFRLTDAAFQASIWEDEYEIAAVPRRVRPEPLFFMGKGSGSR